MDTLVNQTRTAAQTHLTTAKELSLIRHTLNDELTDLTQGSRPLEYREDREPVLLEDLETLHRDLNELQSVKQYVQVIEYALKLRQVKRWLSLSRRPDLFLVKPQFKRPKR